MKKIKLILMGVLVVAFSLIGVAQVSADEQIEKDDTNVSFQFATYDDNLDTIVLEVENLDIKIYNDVDVVFDYQYNADTKTVVLLDFETIIVDIIKENNLAILDAYSVDIEFHSAFTGDVELTTSLNVFIDEWYDLSYGVAIKKECLIYVEGRDYYYISEIMPVYNKVIIQNAPLYVELTEASDNMYNRFLEEVYVSLFLDNEYVSLGEYEEIYGYDPGVSFLIKYSNFLSIIRNVEYEKLNECELNIYIAVESETIEAPLFVYQHDDTNGRIKLKDMLYFNENNDLCLHNKLLLTIHQIPEAFESESNFYTDGEVYISSYNINSPFSYDAEFVLYTAEEIAELTPTPDTQAPKIYGTKEYTVSTKTQYSIDTIKGALFAEDNSGEEVEIKLFSDYYTENYQTPGTYYVTFCATDSSGNTATYQVKINVKDTQAPVFYDKDGKEVTSTTVYKSLDSVLLISEVMEKMTVTDDVDGEIKTVSIVKDNYTGYGDEVGTYTIILRARDAAGNKTDFTIYVYVLDSMPNKTLIIDKHHIVVENNVKLTADNIAAILKTCGYYKSNTTSYVTIDAEAYTELYDTTGEYLVNYNIVTTSGTEIDGVLTIEVVEARAGDNTLVEEEPNLFMKLINWIWNLIKKIFTFIADLFTGKLFKK